MKKLLACLLVVSASGCPDVTVDPNEVGGPTVEFDPARSQRDKARFIPFPNDLARDPATGKVNLPETNCEPPASKATRENVLNKLDGFGTYEVAMQVTFTAEVDPASLTDHVVMVQLTDGGMDLSGALVEIVPPPEAARALGADWRARIALPKIALRTWLIPDWEYPGYWLLKDNRTVSCAELADLLADHPDM